MSKDLLPPGRAAALAKRKLTEETCAKWGYTLSEMGGEAVSIANYRDTSGNIVAQKVRTKGKDFRFLGDTKHSGLYGQHLWRDGGRKVVITEGELDALSVSQIQNHKWPVVSLPTGASGAKKAIQREFEWLDGFEEIILMFDMDDAGRAAVEDVGTIRFKPGKLKVARLPLKDASEMLVAGRGSEVVDAIFGARVYRPDGILSGADVWDRVNTSEEEDKGLMLPYQRLMEMTLGPRPGEVWTFTAGSGIGKSTIVRELAYGMFCGGSIIGMIMLEEDVKRTARGLVGLHLNLPAHAVWKDIPPEDRKMAFDATVGTERIFLYDHFGSTDFDNLSAKIRYMAGGCGCQVIVLDHLSIIVSGSADGDERRMIDNIMTDLKTLAMELGVAILLVSHLKRPGGDVGHEDGARTSLAQLRGSHAIAQLSDFVIGAERDQQGSHKNIITLRVLKNRYTGETGVAGWLLYDPETGRLVELQTDPFNTDGEAFGTQDYSTEDSGEIPL